MAHNLRSLEELERLANQRKRATAESAPTLTPAENPTPPKNSRKTTSESDVTAPAPNLHTPPTVSRSTEFEDYNNNADTIYLFERASFEDQFISSINKLTSVFNQDVENFSLTEDDLATIKILLSITGVVQHKIVDRKSIKVIRVPKSLSAEQIEALEQNDELARSQIEFLIKK